MVRACIEQDAVHRDQTANAPSSFSRAVKKLGLRVGHAAPARLKGLRCTMWLFRRMARRHEPSQRGDCQFEMQNRLRVSCLVAYISRYDVAENPIFVRAVAPVAG